MSDPDPAAAAAAADAPADMACETCKQKELCLCYQDGDVELTEDEERMLASLLNESAAETMRREKENAAMHAAEQIEACAHMNTQLFEEYAGAAAAAVASPGLPQTGGSRGDNGGDIDPWMPGWKDPFDEVSCPPAHPHPAS